MRYETLDGWLQWQQTLHPKAIDMSLNRIAAVASNMSIDTAGLKSQPVQIVTIAGTNGKGSCVKSFESLLLAQGKTVGCFTSPHLLRYNERIRINNASATDSDILSAFAAIDNARGDISLTYFEFSTLAALYLFKEHKVDFIVLEVGLGGRLDSTNIIDADLCVVTSIDIDHVQWLGDNRESIGREKAGIFRANTPAICADCDPPQSISAYADQCGARLYDCFSGFRYAVNDGTLQISLQKDASDTLEISVPTPNLPIGSVASAIAGLALLGQLPAEPTLVQTVQNLQLAGRNHRVQIGNVTVILDVAHNPAAARSMASRIEKSPKVARLALCAAMADKDLAKIFQPLAGLFLGWFLPTLEDNSRASTPENTATLLRPKLDPQVELVVFNDFKSSLDSALSKLEHLSDNGTNPVELYIFGSFYTVEAGMRALNVEV